MKQSVNATGGTIANKTGADGSTSTGIGIYLNNTASVVLRRKIFSESMRTKVNGNYITPQGGEENFKL